MLRVIFIVMLSVIVLNIVMLRIMRLSVIMLNAIMLIAFACVAGCVKLPVDKAEAVKANTLAYLAEL